MDLCCFRQSCLTCSGQNPSVIVQPVNIQSYHYKAPRYTPYLRKTSHLWLAITLRHMNRFRYFWQKCYDKVGNQKCVNMPPQVTCASALPGKRGNTKITFSLKRCISQEHCSSWTVLHAQYTSVLSSCKKSCHL